MSKLLIGQEVRKLSYALKRTLSLQAKQEQHGLTTFQTEVILMVSCAEEEGTYVVQKDVEMELGVKRASVSINLNNMEELGLITRMSIESDGRFKKILLSPKSEEIVTKLRANVATVEEKLLDNISPEDIEHLQRIFAQIECNANQIEEDLKGKLSPNAKKELPN